MSPLRSSGLKRALVVIWLALLVLRLVLVVDLVVAEVALMKPTIIWPLARLEKSIILRLEGHDFCLLARHIDTLDQL